MKTPKICPRCAAFIKKGTEKCPECGVVFSDYYGENKNKAKIQEPATEVTKNKQEHIVLEKTAKRHKHKTKKQHKKIEVGYIPDDKGQINIPTGDVSFLEEPASRSIKEARGDRIPPKLKWWEIYKWADRKLASRKIMKVVNKASTQIPDRISNLGMFFLCLFFGWCGAHSLYARNWVRGGVVAGMSAVMFLVILQPTLYKIMGIFVGGGLGFIVLFMWMIDLIRIILKKYRFASSRREFISSLDFATRAKLGRRYIKKEIEGMETNNAENKK